MIKKFSYIIAVYRRIADDCAAVQYQYPRESNWNGFFEARTNTYREAAKDIQKIIEESLGICLEV